MGPWYILNEIEFQPHTEITLMRQEDYVDLHVFRNKQIFLCQDSKKGFTHIPDLSTLRRVIREYIRLGYYYTDFRVVGSVPEQFKEVRTVVPYLPKEYWILADNNSDIVCCVPFTETKSLLDLGLKLSGLREVRNLFPLY